MPRCGVGTAVAAVAQNRRLNLLGECTIGFDPEEGLLFERHGRLPSHSSGLRFTALADGDVIGERVYYSAAGGFVATADEAGRPVLAERETRLPQPFANARGRC